MKRLPLFFLILLGLLSCSSNNRKKDRTVSVKHVIDLDGAQEKLLRDTSIVINPSNEVSICVFDDLPDDSKAKFIAEHKEELDTMLLLYYDQYAGIEDIDTIAEILNLCYLSPKISKDVFTFYIHVLFELLKNTHIDGYAGELMVDACYNLFSNYPAIFYQHLKLLDKEIIQVYAENIAVGCYYNDVEIDKLDTILRKQEMMMPAMRKQIRMVGEEVKRRYDSII